VTDESYARFKRELDEWLGMTIEYRVCEMPIFVADEFRLEMEEAGREIIRQCTSPEAIQRTDATLQDRYRVPNEHARPLFAVTDFAVTRDDDGHFKPRLIELQGFPSLLGYQHVLARKFQESYDLEGSALMGGLTETAYLDIVRRAIYADHDPEECALIEIDPDRQKTRSDFLALNRFIGLHTVDIRHLEIEQSKVYATINGRRRQLKRLFNRAIVDELDDLGSVLPFKWSDHLDVEWAGHPNWYFRISKFSMPFVHHESVPTTLFLHELDVVPEDLSNYVLKPLYSFAGKGVNVQPQATDIEALAEDERAHWILQQKVEYAPCIPTPFGDNKVEIRVMYIWLDEWDEPRAVMSLARTGRGIMMGARYNTEPWTGSSGCLFFP
jgi:hypothetical protein